MKSILSCRSLLKILITLLTASATIIRLNSIIFFTDLERIIQYVDYSYTKVVAASNALKKRLKLNMIGFHQMDLARIMEMTGLSVEEATRAS
ncbi:MAG: hypothetical protein DMG06_08395 [Acidobacteria bacterium]|nr:MAG: hypothetical protein DMG06_08395 [Acidobacteriota bacterium]